jgi:hypothetical protein
MGDRPAEQTAVSIVSRLALGVIGFALLAACASNTDIGAPQVRSNLARPAMTTWGLLPNGRRDKFHWPLASRSLWNTAIGSGATYKPAYIVSRRTFFAIDPAVLVMTPAAPLTRLYYNGAGWSGRSRCRAGSKVLAEGLPIPPGFVVPSTLDNNSAAILKADGVYFEQNQPFTRCKAGGKPTALVDFGLSDIYDDGVTGAHGGSGLSALGGVIRYGEFTSGKIHHPMQIELWSRDYYYCCKPIWPATVVDDGAKRFYHGKLAYLAPGALLALLPGFDVNSLQTVPGKILAKAFQDYGAYVVDDSAWNDWNITVEAGPKWNTASEFRSLYGYDLQQAHPWKTPFYRDIVTIFESLQVVTNNAAGTIGGGGKPRQSAPPSIGN